MGVSVSERQTHAHTRTLTHTRTHTHTALAALLTSKTKQTLSTVVVGLSWSIVRVCVFVARLIACVCLCACVCARVAVLQSGCYFTAPCCRLLWRLCLTTPAPRFQTLPLALVLYKHTQTHTLIGPSDTTGCVSSSLTFECGSAAKWSPDELSTRPLEATGRSSSWFSELQ